MAASPKAQRRRPASGDRPGRRSWRAFRRARAGRAASGFTLLEIAIVLFIMGLILTIATPYFASLRTAALRSEARRLAGRATYLFDAAQTRQIVLRVTFDLDDNGYLISYLDPYGLLPIFAPYQGPSGNRFAMPPGVRLRDVWVEGRGTFIHGKVSSNFYPAGYVDATVIHLADTEGEVFTISLNPLTGQVSVVNGDSAPRIATQLEFEE